MANELTKISPRITINARMSRRCGDWSEKLHPTHDATVARENARGGQERTDRRANSHITYISTRDASISIQANCSKQCKEAWYKFFSGLEQANVPTFWKQNNIRRGLILNPKSVRSDINMLHPIFSVHQPLPPPPTNPPTHPNKKKSINFAKGIGYSSDASGHPHKHTTVNTRTPTNTHGAPYTPGSQPPPTPRSRG